MFSEKRFIFLDTPPTPSSEEDAIATQNDNPSETPETATDSSDFVTQRAGLAADLESTPEEPEARETIRLNATVMPSRIRGIFFRDLSHKFRAFDKTIQNTPEVSEILNEVKETFLSSIYYHWSHSNPRETDTEGVTTLSQASRLERSNRHLNYNEFLQSAAYQKAVDFFTTTYIIALREETPPENTEYRISMNGISRMAGILTNTSLYIGEERFENPNNQERDFFDLVQIISRRQSVELAPPEEERIINFLARGSNFSDYLNNTLHSNEISPSLSNAPYLSSDALLALLNSNQVAQIASTTAQSLFSANPPLSPQDRNNRQNLIARLSTHSQIGFTPRVLEDTLQNVAGLPTETFDAISNLITQDQHSTTAIQGLNSDLPILSTAYSIQNPIDSNGRMFSMGAMFVTGAGALISLLAGISRGDPGSFVMAAGLTALGSFAFNHSINKSPFATLNNLYRSVIVPRSDIDNMSVASLKEFVEGSFLRNSGTETTLSNPNFIASIKLAYVEAKRENTDLSFERLKSIIQSKALNLPPEEADALEATIPNLTNYFNSNSIGPEAQSSQLYALAKAYIGLGINTEEDFYQNFSVQTRTTNAEGNPSIVTTTREQLINPFPPRDSQFSQADLDSILANLAPRSQELPEEEIQHTHLESTEDIIFPPGTIIRISAGSELGTNYRMPRILSEVVPQLMSSAMPYQMGAQNINILSLIEPNRDSEYRNSRIITEPVFFRSTIEHPFIFPANFIFDGNMDIFRTEEYLAAHPPAVRVVNPVDQNQSNSPTNAPEAEIRIGSSLRQSDVDAIIRQRQNNDEHHPIHIDATLREDIIIPANYTLSIPEGARLEVPEQDRDRLEIKRLRLGHAIQTTMNNNPTSYNSNHQALAIDSYTENSPST